MPSDERPGTLRMNTSHEGGTDDRLHVAPRVVAIPCVSFAKATPTIPHKLTEHDRKPLHEALEIAERRGIVVETELLQGNPAYEIVTYADTIDADLIVVGSCGHGAVASAAIGSVSRGVLLESRRPVLVVRGPNVAAEAGVPA